jgi:hypothetical protein
MVRSRVYIINISAAFQLAHSSILEDIDSLIDEKQIQSDILRIVYHHILYNTCELIKDSPAGHRCVVIHQATEVMDELLELYNCNMSSLNIFANISRVLPSYCYRYDSRYGPFESISPDSGEYIEIITEILSKSSRSTIKAAVAFARDMGLTYIHRKYLKDPGIKLLFCK